MTLIEFLLPQGAGAMAAAGAAAHLRRKLEETCQPHNLTYHIRIDGLRFRVTFPENKDYTVFALVWRPIRGLPYNVLIQMPKVGQ